MAEGRVELRGDWDPGAIERGLDDLRSRLERLEALGKSLDIEPDPRFERAFAEIERLRAELRSLDEGDERRIVVEAQIEQALRELSRLERDSKRHLDAVARAARENPFDDLGRHADREVRQMVGEFQRLEKRWKESLRDMEQAARRTDLTPRDLERLRQRLRRASQDVIAFARRVPRDLRQAGTGFDRVAAAATRAERAIQRFARNPAPSAFAQLTRSMRAATLGMQAFLGGLVVQRLVQFGRALIQTSAEMQRFRAQFRGLFGGEQGTRQFERLQQVSDALGASFETVREAGGRFTLALQKAGFEAGEADAILTSLIATAQGLGGGYQTLNSLLRTFEQIASKGRLQAEEVNKELANVGVSASQVAESLGISNTELQQMFRTGGELATIALPKLAAQLLKTFGPAAVESQELINSNWERTRNLIDRTAEAMGDRFLPVLAEVIAEFNEASEEGGSAAQKLGDVMGKAIRESAEQWKALVALVRGEEGSLSRVFAGLTQGFADTAEQTDVLARRRAEAAREIEEAQRKLAESNAALGRTFGKLAADATQAFDKLQERGKKGDSLRRELDRLQRQMERLSGVADELRRKGLLTDEHVRKAKELQAAFDRLSLRAVLDDADKLGERLASIQPPDLSVSVGGEGLAEGFSDLEQAVQSAQQRLQELLATREELRTKDFPTQEELSRLGGMDAEIAEASAAYATLQRELDATIGLQRQLGEEAALAGEPQQDVIKRLLDLLESLRTQYQSLAPELRTAFDSAFESLATLADQGGVTQSTMVLFGEQLRAIFAGGGESARQFADAVADQIARAAGVTGSGADQIRDALGRMGSGAEESAGQVGTAAGEMEAAGGRVSGAAEVIATGAGRVKSEADGARIKLGNVATQADEVAAHFRALGEEPVPVSIADTGKAADEAKRQFDELARGTQPAADAMARVADPAEKAGVGLQQVADSSAPAAEGIAQVGTASAEASEPVGKVAQSVGEMGAGAQQAGETLPQVAAAVTDLGAAAAEISESGSVGQLSSDVEALATQLGAAQSALAEILTHLQDSGEAAETFAGSAEEAGRAAEELVDDETLRRLSDLADRLERMAKGSTDSAAGTRELKDALGETLDVIGQVQTRLGDLVQGLDEQVGPQLDETRAQFAALRADLDSLRVAIEQLFSALLEALSRAGAGIAQLRSQIAGLIGDVETAIDRLGELQSAQAAAGL